MTAVERRLTQWRHSTMRWCCTSVSLLLSHFLTMWPWPLTLLIGGRGIMIDYPWFGFKPSWFYYADRQTDTHRQTDRITEADDRYIHVTTVGVSNDKNEKQKKLVNLYYLCHWKLHVDQKSSHAAQMQQLRKDVVPSLHDRWWLCLDQQLTTW